MDSDDNDASEQGPVTSAARRRYLIGQGLFAFAVIAMQALDPPASVWPWLLGAAALLGAVLVWQLVTEQGREARHRSKQVVRAVPALHHAAAVTIGARAGMPLLVIAHDVPVWWALWIIPFFTGAALVGNHIHGRSSAGTEQKRQDTRRRADDELLRRKQSDDAWREASGW